MNFTFTPSFLDMYRNTLAESYGNVFLILLNSALPLAGLSMLGLSSALGHPLSWSDALALFVMIFSTPLLNLAVVFVIRRHNRLFRGEYSYTFTEASIDYETEFFVTRFKWAAVTRAKENRGGLTVYVGSMGAVFLPARVLGASGDAGGLRALLRARLGAKAAVLS